VRWVGVVVAVLLGGLLVGVTGYLVGEARAPEAMVVRELSAERLSAMLRTDAFFTEYRDAAVVVTGSVEHSEPGRLRFATRGWGEVWCAMAEGSATPAAGERITIVTIGARGERLGEEDEDLLLQDCTQVLSPR
jgi:hypothetical protein